MVYATIDGHNYPMRLGMMAVKNLEKDIGSLPEVVEMINSPDDEIRSKALYGLAFAMIDNGLKVESIECDIVPNRPRLKSADHIEAVIAPAEELKLFYAISEALTADSKTSIQASVPDDGSKKKIVTPEA